MANRTGKPLKLQGHCTMLVAYDPSLSVPAIIDTQRVRVAYGRPFFLFCKGMQAFLVESVDEFYGHLADFKINEIAWDNLPEMTLTFTTEESNAETP